MNAIILVSGIAIIGYIIIRRCRPVCLNKYQEYLLQLIITVIGIWLSLYFTDSQEKADNKTILVNLLNKTSNALERKVGWEFSWLDVNLDPNYNEADTLLYFDDPIHVRTFYDKIVNEHELYSLLSSESQLEIIRYQSYINKFEYRYSKANTDSLKKEVLKMAEKELNYQAQMLRNEADYLNGYISHNEFLERNDSTYQRMHFKLLF